MPVPTERRDCSMNELELRKALLAIGDREWLAVAEQCRSLRLELGEIVENSAAVDARETRRWIKDPKRHRGNLRNFVMSFYHDAARLMRAKNPEGETEADLSDLESWKAVLDFAHVGIGVEYAGTVALMAPRSLEWIPPTVPAVAVSHEGSAADRADLEPAAAPSATRDVDAVEVGGGAAMDAQELLARRIDEARAAGIAVIDAVRDINLTITEARLIGDGLARLAAAWDDALSGLSLEAFGEIRLDGDGFDPFETELTRRREQVVLEVGKQQRIVDLRKTIEYLTIAPEHMAASFAGQLREARAELAQLEGVDVVDDQTDPVAAPDVVDEPVEVVIEVVRDSAVTEPPDDEVPSAEPAPAENSASDVLDEAFVDDTAADCPDQESEGVVGSEEAAETYPRPAGGQTQPSPREPACAEVATVVDQVKHRAALPPRAWVDPIEGLTALVEDGQWAAVAAVAHLVPLDPDVAYAVTMCAEAFTLPMTDVDPGELLIRDGDMRPLIVEDRGSDAAVLLAVAALRACLEVGQAEYILFDDHSFDDVSPEWAEALQVFRGALTARYRHRWDRDAERASDNQPVRLKSEVAQLLATLPKRTLRLERASRVLRYLVNEGALHAALTDVAGWSDGMVGVDILRAQIELLSEPDTLIKEADKEVSSVQQLRKEIVASARDGLRRAIGEVRDLLKRAVASDSRRVDTDSAANLHTYDQVHGAVKALPDTMPNRGLVGAALLQLREWLRAGAAAAELEETTFGALSYRASLPAVSAVRSESTGLLVESDVSLILAELLQPYDHVTTLNHYLTGGNLAAASALARADDDALIAVRTREWRTASAKRAQALQTTLLRTHAQTAMSAGDRHDFEARIASLEMIPEGRFDVAKRRGDDVEQAISELREDNQAMLRQRLADIVRERSVSADDVERVEKSIRDHDVLTTHEFLASLERRGQLPADISAGQAPLPEFRSLLERLPSSIPNVVTEAERHGARDLPRRVEEGLRAWNLARGSKRPADWADSLHAILGVLGLQRDAHVPIREVKRPEQQRWASTYSVKASPTGGSYIASLGTTVDRYFVTIIRSDASVEAVLEVMPDTARGMANILVYPGVLTWKQRKQLLGVARRLNITALLVDAAVMVYLASKGAESFKLLQDVTLPFAVFNHWAPGVAGDVPDELFVGRVKERGQIVSASGSLFVYGGRQLGKSALLNRIRREFNKDPAHLAIYIDLKAAGIGQQNEPEHLWTVLGLQLKEAGIMAEKKKADATSIVAAIRHWLGEDETRRMLLLCDESDAFLDLEARLAESRPGRAITFPNVGLLKGLMDETQRRFKPVFAGLHQVQRIGHVSNSPLAHGGRDILVGPLAAEEARELVVRPFRALGYTFGSPELVWRLIAFTNYQAGLVQIVCDGLVTHLRQKVIREIEPPYVITADDVDTVIADPDIRNQIADKFKLTIRLEDRYLVIALTIALRSLDDSFERGYLPSEILEDCLVWWEAGFAPLTRAQFGIYLEEMEGLGVLMKGSDGGYAIRSPNVVHMLGRREEIEALLEDGADSFQLPQEYNPKVTRRLIGSTKVPAYSPMTEHDLALALPSDQTVQHAVAIIGSPALGIGSVHMALQNVIEHRGYGMELLQSNQGEELSKAGSGAKAGRPILVCDAAGDAAAGDVLVSAIGRASVLKIDRRAVVLGPASAQHVGDLALNGVVVVPLQPWTSETVRATIEDPISEPELRERFVQAGGGWPSLCQGNFDRLRAGVPVTEVIDDAEAFPADTAAAEDFLISVGIVSSADRELVTQWADIAVDGEAVPSETLASILDLDVGDLTATLDRFAVLSTAASRRQGWILNTVVWRAARSILADS